MIDPTIKDDIIDYIPISAFDVDNISRKEVIKNNNYNMKRHLISFGVTFITALAVVLVGQIDDITLATVQSGAIYGILFAAVRAGIKGVLELVILQNTK